MEGYDCETKLFSMNFNIGSIMSSPGEADFFLFLYFCCLFVNIIVIQYVN
jgi:hypothetical protein